MNGGTPTGEDCNWGGDVPWATPVDLARVDGGVLAATERTLTESGLRSGSRVVPAGSLVLSTRAPIGYVAESAARTAFNQGCRGLLPITPLNLKYFRYQFTSVTDCLRARGQGSTFVELSGEHLASFQLVVPPLATQHAIADYLDRETARIDALSKAKEKMTALLNEKRRRLRDEVFACKPGLRLKRLLSTPMAYGVLVPEFVEPGTGVPMIRTYNLSPVGEIDHGDIAEIPVNLAQEYKRTSLCSGDLILSVVGSMGRSAVASPTEGGFNLNRPLARLQFRPEVPPRLMWHWTQTTHFMDSAALATSRGTAQPTLNLSDLANFTIGLPDALERWPEILNSLEVECTQLDDAEKALQRQITLLQERRQALITAAVTGQLDIPEAS